MHDIQRKAIFAMLTAVEQQLAGIRGLLSLDGGPVAIQAAPYPKGQTNQAQSYLSDTEDEELEKAMEAERQALLAHEKRMAHAWETGTRGPGETEPS